VIFIFVSTPKDFGLYSSRPRVEARDVLDGRQGLLQLVSDWVADRKLPGIPYGVEHRVVSFANNAERVRCEKSALKHRPIFGRNE
jgi:hypothetical protein